MSRTRRSCSDCSMPTIPMASKACQVRIRWAEEEIGRNSVMPWTMARMAIWRSDKWAIPGEEEGPGGAVERSEEHTSELQSLMRISYAVFCLTKKITTHHDTNTP